MFQGTDRYDVIERLGTGGMGTVYAALDRLTGAKVALKHLHQQRPDSLELFKREFRNFQDILHRNLISLGELRADGGEWFFTMELLIGKSFDEFIRAGAHALEVPMQRSSTFLARGVSMPAKLFNGMVRRVSAFEQPRSQRRYFHEGRLRDALGQLACGLAVLHRANKVHSDVKPSNIVVESSGRLVILDFGISVDIDEQRHWIGDRVLGTASYMAPEQVDPAATSPASDCYAVGTLLYEALTGTRPFTGHTATQLLALKQTTLPRLPSRLATGIPSDLERLCMDLLAIEPGERPSATDILRRLNAWDLLAELTTETADERPTEDVFVGRKQELEALLTASRPPISSRIMAVCGPSGIGKSALLEHFRRRLVDTLVLSGRCYERESVPFKGIDSVIQDLLDHIRRLQPTELDGLIPRDVARIAAIFPRFGLLFDVDSVTQDPDATPYDQRRAAFAELRALMTRLARRTPVVVTIDDMQWADSDTWALLGHLMRRPHPPPILMVLSMRTQDGSKHNELEQLGTIEHLPLSPLTLAESRAMAVHLLSGTARRDENLAEEIASESEGHPLFIQTIIHHAGEHLALDVHSGLLEEALQARFASLSPEARQLLQLLATAGTPVKHSTIAATVGMDFEGYLRSVGELRTRHLIHTTGIELDRTIALDHERVREAVLARLSEDQTHKLHLQLAEALEKTDAASELPELLAHHLQAGGRPEQASGYLLKAAEQAMDSLAFDSASSLYRAALSAGVFAEDERLRILLLLADAQVDSGRGREAADAFLQVAGATDDRALRLRCLYKASEQLLLCGDLTGGREVLNRVLSAIDVKLPTTRRGTIWSLLVRRLWLRIRGLGWRERKAQDIAEYQLLRLDIERSCGRVMSLVEPVGAAVMHCRALLLALRVGEPVRVGWCLAFEAAFHAVKNRKAAVRSRALLDRAEEIAERTENAGLQACVIANRGLLEYFDGRFREAYRLLTESVGQLSRLPGYHWERITAQTVLLLTVRAMGQFRELGALREQYLHDAMDRGDLYTQTTVRHVSSIVWLSANDVARSRRDIADSSWNATSYDLQLQHWYEMRTRAEIALYEGEDRPVLLDSLAEISRVEKSMLSRVQLVRIESRFLRGRLLLATAPERRRPIRRLVRNLKREPNPVSAIAVAYLQTALCALDGDIEGTRHWLTRAESLASDAGAEWKRQVARYWRGRSLGAIKGASLVESSLAWMNAQGIENPPRLSRLLIPLPEARLAPEQLVAAPEPTASELSAV